MRALPRDRLIQRFRDLFQVSRIDVVPVRPPLRFARSRLGLLRLQGEGQSFGQALRNALREDPDVILVGEMRDFETVRMAITAAETGHLVISTLHTMDAAETINRIIDVFPSHQQDQVRVQLAVNLRGVIGQTLLRRADGKGRIAAFEVMANTSAVAAAIRDNKIYQIPSAIQTGTRAGMISLDQYLAQLVRTGQVGFEEALTRAKNPDDFRQIALATRPAQPAPGQGRPRTR